MEEYAHTELDRERYWAAEDGTYLDANDQLIEREDPAEVLIESCRERFKCYAGYLENSDTFQTIARNYLYYHGMYYGRNRKWTFRELRRLGAQGELVGVNINHFRNLIKHTLAIITQHKLQIEAQAINTDRESIEQARLGDATLESYIQKDRIDRYMKRALEHAFVLLQGYVLADWDFARGKKLVSAEEKNPDTGEEFGDNTFEGDVVLSNPSIFDVASDPCVDDHDKKDWFIVRQWMNRWTLIAMYPDLAEQIVEVDNHDSDQHEHFFFHFNPEERAGQLTDQVPVFTLFHRPTTALPQGKRFSYVGDVALDPPNNPLMWDRVTLRRVVASEYLLTSLGYSPACDLQAPQEIYNNISSTIATNIKAFGVKNVWTQQNDPVKTTVLDGGLRHLSSRTKPEQIDLQGSNADSNTSKESAGRDMENLSGVSGTVRGAPEANIKSGTAMALIDAKSVQFSSPAAEAYHQLWEDVGSDILYLVNFHQHPEFSRTIHVTGIRGRSIQRELTYGGLNNVDRVLVRAGSALARTQSGRLELANLFLKAGLIRIPEELINVIDSGQIDPLLDAERSQLDIVRAENERFLKGDFEVAAMATDNHVMHIREHQVLMNNDEFRMNLEAAGIVMAHIMEHIAQLSDPNVQMLQAMLGFSIGLPGMGGPPMGGQGGPGVGDIPKNNPDGPQLDGARQPRQAKPPGMSQSA